MSDSGWRRLGAATGVGFVLLLVLSYILGANDPPAFDEGAQAVFNHVSENENKIDAAAALLAGALVFFAFFIGAIAGNSRRVDRDGRLTAAGHAGGIAALVLAGMGIVLQSGASAAADPVQGADPNVVAGLFNAGAGAFAGASLGAAVLVLATSMIAIRFGALPSLLGYAGLALAVGTAVVAIIGITTRDGAFSPYDGELPLIFLGFFVVWVLVVSVSLWDRAGRR